MAAPDVSALASSFVGSASIFKQNLLKWDLRSQGVQIRTNVKTPQALNKLSAVGGPRPYSTGDNFTTGPKHNDRLLTAYQSKWDYEFDEENYRNTYLAELPENMSFEQAAMQQVADTYLDSLIKNTLYLGVRNGAGTAAADIANGWGKIIADEIVATNITPVVTGAITSANAVTKVEQVADATQIWMKKKGYRIYCSYQMFQDYATHYRTLNGFQFQPNVTGGYRLDNRNAILTPADFMGTSRRLIATVDGNLVFGSDAEQVQVHATPYLNYIKVRLMMPVGLQIQDLEALVVNDQA